MPNPCEKQLDEEMLELLKAPFHFLYFFSFSVTSCRTNFIHCSFDLKMPASGVALKSIIEGATLGKALGWKGLSAVTCLWSCRWGAGSPRSPHCVPLPRAGSSPSAWKPPRLGPQGRQECRGGHPTQGADVNRFWKVHPDVFWPKPLGISLISSWHKLELHRREESAQKKIREAAGGGELPLSDPIDYPAALRPGASVEVDYYWSTHHGNNQINSFLIKLPLPRPFSSPALIPEVLR